MARVKRTQETSHAHGRSKLRWERKSSCLSKILSWKKVPVVERITYYCTTVKMTARGWLDDIALQGPRPLLHLPIIFTWDFILMFHWDIEVFLQLTTFHFQQQVLNISHIRQAAIIRMCNLANQINCLRSLLKDATSTSVVRSEVKKLQVFSQLIQFAIRGNILNV